MKHFKYKSVRDIDANSDDKLNLLGNLGWELVTSYWDNVMHENVFIFKQEMEEIIIKS